MQQQEIHVSWVYYKGCFKILPTSLKWNFSSSQYWTWLRIDKFDINSRRKLRSWLTIHWLEVSINMRGTVFCALFLILLPFLYSIINRCELERLLQGQEYKRNLLYAPKAQIWFCLSFWFMGIKLSNGNYSCLFFLDTMVKLWSPLVRCVRNNGIKERLNLLENTFGDFAKKKFLVLVIPWRWIFLLAFSCTCHLCAWSNQREHRVLTSCTFSFY